MNNPEEAFEYLEKAKDSLNAALFNRDNFCLGFS
jgi:hypothetical protein